MLYDVETGHLKQAVKRNPQRFPKDFMFVLNDMEAKYEEQFKLVYTTLRELILPEPKPRKRIGYKHYDEKKDSPQSIEL